MEINNNYSINKPKGYIEFELIKGKYDEIKSRAKRGEFCGLGYDISGVMDIFISFHSDDKDDTSLLISKLNEVEKKLNLPLTKLEKLSKTGN